VSEFLTALQNN